MNRQLQNILENHQRNDAAWPPQPEVFGELLNATEAAMFLRLHEVGHTPKSARRTLDFWRYRGELKATKFARHVWYMRRELERFLRNRTEKQGV